MVTMPVVQPGINWMDLTIRMYPDTALPTNPRGIDVSYRFYANAVVAPYEEGEVLGAGNAFNGGFNVDSYAANHPRNSSIFIWATADSGEDIKAVYTRIKHASRAESADIDTVLLYTNSSHSVGGAGSEDQVNFENDLVLVDAETYPGFTSATYTVGAVVSIEQASALFFVDDTARFGLEWLSSENTTEESIGDGYVLDINFDQQSNLCSVSLSASSEPLFYVNDGQVYSAYRAEIKTRHSLPIDLTELRAYPELWTSVQIRHVLSSRQVEVSLVFYAYTEGGYANGEDSQEFREYIITVHEERFFGSTGQNITLFASAQSGTVVCKDFKATVLTTKSIPSFQRCVFIGSNFDVSEQTEDTLVVNLGPYTLIKGTPDIFSINSGITRISGNLSVGSFEGSNHIAFRGTARDGYEDSVPSAYIGERIYEPYTERSELVLCKGEDPKGATGVDRVRVLSGEFRVDIFSNIGTSGAEANTYVYGRGGFEDISNAESRSILIANSDGVYLDAPLSVATYTSPTFLPFSAVMTDATGNLITTTPGFVSLDFVGNSVTTNVVTSTVYKSPRFQPSSAVATDANGNLITTTPGFVSPDFQGNSVTVNVARANTYTSSSFNANGIVMTNAQGNLITTYTPNVASISANVLRTRGLLTANGFTSPFFAANSLVTTDHLGNLATAFDVAANSVTANNLTAGRSLTAGNISATTYSSPLFQPLSVLMTDATGNLVTTYSPHATSVTTNVLTANALTAKALLTANGFTSPFFAANSLVTTDSLGNLATALDVAANSVTANNLTAGRSLTAGNISATTYSSPLFQPLSAVMTDAGGNLVTTTPGFVSPDFAGNSVTANVIIANVYTSPGFQPSSAVMTDAAGNLITTAPGFVSADFQGNSVTVNVAMASIVSANNYTSQFFDADALVMTNAQGNLVTTYYPQLENISANAVVANTISSNILTVNLLETVSKAPLLTYDIDSKTLGYSISKQNSYNNVANLTGTSVFHSLQPRNFTSVKDNIYGVGLIAEEAAVADPMFAWYVDGVAKGVDWFAVLTYAISEIKQLRQELTELKTYIKITP
jgi:hypothetical protein